MKKIADTKECKDCKQTFSLAGMQYKKPCLGKNGGYGARCIACAKEYEREKGRQYRERTASPNTGFEGYRHPDRDAPFPEQGLVFKGWRGPVGEWRVRL